MSFQHIRTQCNDERRVGGDKQEAAAAVVGELVFLNGQTPFFFNGLLNFVIRFSLFLLQNFADTSQDQIKKKKKEKHSQTQ